MTSSIIRANTRREVLTGLGALAVAGLRPATAGSSGESGKLRGRVLAAGSNQGLSGVMISNGRDVVVTDDGGGWELPSIPGRMIFVIKPPGWTYLESSGVPQMSQHAKDASNSSYDFFLRQQHETEAFEVALVADTQAANITELDYVRREIDRCVTPGAYAFAISHGDVMGDDLNLLAPYREIVHSTGMIWHHCPGNHDLDLSAPCNAQALETWTREIGPAHYAFQYGKATFILLNNVEYLGAGAERVDGRLYRGQIGERQLTFVRNVLRNVPEDHLVVVSMHVPLVSFENPNAPGDNTADRAELLGLLSGFAHTVSFSGHSHTTEHHYLGYQDGFLRQEPHHHHVLTAFCGGWWGGPLNGHGIPVSDSRDGSPRGFHVLRVEGNTYQTRFVPMSGDAGGVVRLSTSKDAAAAVSQAGTTLNVDVFDGGPRTRIRCRLPNADGAVELTRTVISDPHIVASYERYRELLKPWVVAAPSSHMWTATLPPGTEQACILEITDEYGFEKRVQVFA